MTLVDTLYFGHLVATPLNFVRTNLSSVSLFYGQNPWHFYLTQALPILCATLLPFNIKGWYRALGGQYGQQAGQLAIVVLVTIIVYSCAGHKEWRFIHPLLPILHILTSKVLVDSCTVLNSGQVPKNAKMQRKKEGNSLRNTQLIRRSHIYLIFSTLPLSLYVMRYHGQAQIAVVRYLRSLPPSELRSVGFLMPCHSTPVQSYLHRPELGDGLLWALGCEPPLE